MAHTIRLTFLLRCISSRKHQLIRPTRLPLMSNPFASKPLRSLSSSLQTNTATDSDPKPASLSARMSFVFDQIDAIERERAQKDETLQRIRAWRESKKSKTSHEDNNKNLAFDGELNPSESIFAGTGSSELKEEEEKERVRLLDREVELVHPWPEWIELMERLVQQNYFDHRRKDEDKMIRDLGFQMSEVAEEVFDFTRDWKTVETACLNFGRDRFDILRSLSRQDISTLVGHGCPSADKKVVFSAKLLRKHTHLDEGDVCSSCKLRNTCEKAYLLTKKEDEARTIDVMRVLLTYGFDPVNGSVVNESLLKRKSVKAVVRKLLHEVVKLSAVPIDPNLPPPIIKKPPPKVKQPPPPPKKRVGRDDIEMKKGDWLCPKCDFMNFAKNTVCLQCDAKRPQRQLLPGEWECPQCKFLNYRRNMVCFHCEHKRPPDEYMENQLQDRHRGSKARLEKVPSRAEISNAWNFDFDDDESDGADVAAFEYADSRKMDVDFPLHSQAEGERLKGPKDDSYMSNPMPRMHEREHNDHRRIKPGTGFDDFDDEEDDDIDSYELDTQNNNQARKSSAVDFSEVEGPSESEDDEDFEEARISHQTRPWSQNKASSKTMHRKSTLAGSKVDELDFDTDDDLPVHPNWKSSHVADSRQRNRGKGTISFGSDEDYGLSSDTEDFVNSNSGSRPNKGDKRISKSWDSRKRRIPASDDETFSSLDTDDEDLPALKQRSRGRTMGPNRRGYSKSNNDFNRSSQRSRDNARGLQRDGYGGHRKNDRGSGFRNFRGSNAEGLGNRRRGGFTDYNDRDCNDDRYTRQRINVR